MASCLEKITLKNCTELKLELRVTLWKINIGSETGREGGREEGEEHIKTSPLFSLPSFLPLGILSLSFDVSITTSAHFAIAVTETSIDGRGRRHHFTCCLGSVGWFAWGSEGNKTAVVLSLLCICPRFSAAGNLENGWDCSCLPPCCELHHYDFSIEQAGQAGLPSLSLPLISLLLDSWPT